MTFAQRSESVLIDSVGNPTDGPHLSVVSMSGKFKVDAILFSFFQVIGLMVEFQHKSTLVGALQDDAERLALCVGAVVTSYNGDAVERRRGIAQHPDARFPAKLQVIAEPGVVVVVAQAGDDGNAQGLHPDSRL